VIVPIMPGALSALGILMSDVTKDHSRTLLWEADRKLPAHALEAELRKLRTTANAEFAREGWKGRVNYAASLDLRYKGQGFEINVPLNPNSLQGFHAEHKKRYGYARPANAVEIVTLRLRSWIKSSPVRFKRESAGIPASDRRERGAPRVIERSAVNSVRGPAIITEYSATTFVPQGWGAVADKVGNLLLSRS
jgi:N-methylhydantoinase A